MASGALFRVDIRDPVAEELPNMVFAAPQRRRLGPGRRRRREGLHGGEHLPDEAFGRPAEQADGSAWFAHPHDLVRTGLVVRRKHNAQAGRHHIESVVLERQGFSVGFHPFQLNAAVRCLVPAGVEQFRSEIAGNHLGAHHGRGDGCVPGPRGHVQDTLLGFDSAGVHQDGSEVLEHLAGQGGVVPRSPHGPVLLFQRPVRLVHGRFVVHFGAPLHLH